MGILDQVASAIGEMKQDANCAAAALCLADPALLADIAKGLGGKNARLAGDCAEVMTKVAEKRPELVAPHARLLVALRAHKNGRVRWESLHAFALAAHLVPEVVVANMEALATLIRMDKSVIVRDYAVDAIAAYGTTGPAAARIALPVLLEALSAWQGKHAARTLAGLRGLIAVAPALQTAIHDAAQPFKDHERPGIRKAARAVLKTEAQHE